MGYEDDLIYDVGMHRAEDTEFYLAKGFRVVAVEASPELCEAAAIRLREPVDSGQLTIVHAAIAETEGPIDLFLNPHTEWNTTRPQWSDRNANLGRPSGQVVSVPGVVFNSLLAEHGTPYFLKIDIEGADVLCIESLRPPDLPRYLSIESDKLQWSGLLHEFEVLTGLGYRRFKVVGQHLLPKQRPPNPPLEGNYADRRFTLASSGLFGEEAPGEWLGADAAIERYRKIFKQYRLRGDSGLLSRGPLGSVVMKAVRSPGWYDTHAAL
jgi:FkbM family methyltransferase